MATKQTGKKLDARERARLARTRVDQVRAERDAKIEVTLAEFFTAGDERDTLIAQLAVVENTIGHSVEYLFTLGENASQVANLLDLDPKEMKRLRGLTTPTEPVLSPPRASPADTNSHPVHARP
ncbi:hypothetical protein [Cryobacterium tagatosivorans]|uniref:Uncharacterized protein n=1 Tax=Cryobacterium tagatosivorans TaxID=1259199 RepID=A0A4R8UK66_9MICO|nr:hypothetical protein [Cryobacterium tagatosivorans]TFB56379.1 hypothetical protein E3O23_01205 [Cryobacterium tagatosivorans]